MSKKIENIIAKIQQQAKDQVASLKKPATPSTSIEEIRSNVKSAYGVAISNKKAREYVGNLTEKIVKIVKHSCVIDKPINTEIQPNNCRLMTFNGDVGFLVIEESPRFRTIFDISDGQNEYRIPLPYVIYIIKFEFSGHGFSITNFGVGFRKKPLLSIDDRLHHTHLPHTHGTSGVCFPLHKTYHKSVKDLVSYAINSFWSSAFHYYFSRPFKVGEKSIKSFAQWSKITNQLDILKGSFKIGSPIRSQLHSLGMNRIQEDNKKIVTSIVNQVSKTLNANDISEMMLSNTEEIVNIAIKNALQSEN